jgi:hypothetical protein
VARVVVNLLLCCKEAMPVVYLIKPGYNTIKINSVNNIVFYLYRTMYGWINDVIRSLVLEKFGQETWEAILAKAGETDKTCLRYEYFSDSVTLRLFASMSALLHTSLSDVMESFGEFFIQLMSRQGYSSLMKCLGNTLMEWLSNVDMLHVHLCSTHSKILAPHFRCAFLFVFCIILICTVM